MAGGGRFRDGGSSLYGWAEPVLVVCSACAGRATVTSIGGSGFSARRRLVCAACGLAREASGERSTWGGPVDPWFGCDLWLAAPFRGHTVWAYNGEHAECLRNFVAASLRERSSPPARSGADRIDEMTMVEKLPSWYKAATNRRPLVKILDQMIERAR
jgi:hypothetical protein